MNKLKNPSLPQKHTNLTIIDTLSSLTSLEDKQENNSSFNSTSGSSHSTPLSADGDFKGDNDDFNKIINSLSQINFSENYKSIKSNFNNVNLPNNNKIIKSRTKNTEEKIFNKPEGIRQIQNKMMTESFDEIAKENSTVFLSSNFNYCGDSSRQLKKGRKEKLAQSDTNETNQNLIPNSELTDFSKSNQQRDNQRRKIKYKNSNQCDIRYKSTRKSDDKNYNCSVSSTKSFSKQSIVYIEGVPGVQGKQGPPGNRGPRGVQGPQGAQGIQGEIGLKGIQGLIGPRGAQGPVGPRGPIGPRGHRGYKGDKGNKGNIGPEGPQGVQGEQGIPGHQGLPGNIGPQGLRGEKGEKGECLCCLKELPCRNLRNIIKINTDYNIKPSDDIIIIDSQKPVALRLYQLIDNIQHNVRTTTKLLTINSQCGNVDHLIYASKDNSINDEKKFKLTSHRNVKLLPLGKNWLIV